MSSKLKKAKNLLNNQNARLEELEEIVAEMTIALINKTNNIDNESKESYVNIISRLNVRISKEKLARKNEAEEKAKEKTLNKEFSNKKYNSQVLQKEKEEQIKYKSKNDISKLFTLPNSVVFPRSMEKKHLLPDFLPNDANKGMFIWLDYINMQNTKKICLENNSRRTLTMPDKTELAIVGKIPLLWVGDFMVLDRKQINFYKAVLDVKPVLNFERIKNLFEFYMANSEYRPMHKGELFWTRMTPQPANKPNPNNYYSDKSKRIMPSKVSDYFVKIKDFVVFVNGINNDVLSKGKSTYDFVYTGTNYSGRSGRGFYVEDSLRKIIVVNLGKYLKMEQEIKT